VARNFELKPISLDAVPAALEKAKHYRLLNEPRPAESICLDVLEVDPDNQEALVLLVLAASDQIERRQLEGVRLAQQYLERVRDEYAREYYGGLICERRAKAVLQEQRPRYQYHAYEWFRRAMEHYERAERLRPHGNDDALLRWNTCVRILQRNRELAPEPEEQAPGEHMLE
jgi:hypothetical protein